MAWVGVRARGSTGSLPLRLADIGPGATLDVRLVDNVAHRDEVQEALNCRFDLALPGSGSPVPTMSKAWPLR